ncbi:hypothetical protein KL909_005426, partial [Ogataea angusta]
NTRTTLRVFAPTEITHPPAPRPPGRQTLGIGLSIVPNPRNPSHSVYTAHLIPLTGHVRGIHERLTDA